MAHFDDYFTLIKPLARNIYADIPLSGQIQPTLDSDSVGWLCEQCRAPSLGYRFCIACNKHRNNLLDEVVPLSFASKTSQIYWDLLHYKDEDAADGTLLTPSRLRLAALAFYGYLHMSCFEQAYGSCELLAVVPSERGRKNPFLNKLAQLATRRVANLNVFYTGELHQQASTSAQRVLRPDDFSTDHGGLKGKHVLLFDDSWVTGTTLMSVAAMLRRQGVTRVSAICLARVLEPSWKQNREYAAAWAKAGISTDFNYHHCPVRLTNCGAI